jgi:hypothetical protein
MLAFVSTFIAQGQDIPLGKVVPPTDAFSKGSDTGTTALTNLELFISNTIGFLTTLGSIFFVVYFFLGALSWITSGGDKGKAEKARDQMTQGVLGLVVIIASYAVLGLVGSVIGLKILNPAEQIQLIIPK